jgi:hypothetical protein
LKRVGLGFQASAAIIFSQRWIDTSRLLCTLRSAAADSRKMWSSRKDASRKSVRTRCAGRLTLRSFRNSLHTGSSFRCRACRISYQSSARQSHQYCKGTTPSVRLRHLVVFAFPPINHQFNPRANDVVDTCQTGLRHGP